MLESSIQSKLIKYLEARGVYVVKTIASNKAGVPDVLACHNGRFLAIECKTIRGRLSALQSVHIDRIKKAGGIAIVFKGTDEDYRRLDETITASD